MTCPWDCGRLFRSKCLPLSLDFLTSHFTILMSTVSSSYKVNNHQWILKGVLFLCIKNSVTARCLLCFNIVRMKYKANGYVHQAIPHGKQWTHWNKFCLKVTLHAQDTLEVLLSEHCSYFLIQVSLRVRAHIHTHTHTQTTWYICIPLFNLRNYEINLHYIWYFYFWFQQTNITPTL